jgi:pentatricopeptide repeat protein
MKRGDVAYAPKPLDHFKRGHQERKDSRPKEYYSASSRQHLDHPELRLPGQHAPPQSQARHSFDDSSRRHHPHDEPHHQQHHPPGRNDRYDPPDYDRGTGGGMGGGGGGGGDMFPSSRDRVTVVSGLEISPFLDQLERAHDVVAVERMLAEARTNYPDAFATGKAITALVSGCARRKNTRLAATIWDWCKAENLELNTFHYNSMIAVAASDRKPQEAVKYLREMTERGVAKNEVT